MAAKKQRNRMADMIEAQSKSQEFAALWLKANAVTPEGVELTEEQFGKLMDNFLKALMQAYVKGYTVGAYGE